MLPGHKIKIEQRQRPCCDDPTHWAYVAVCECGKESEIWGDHSAWITGHRLDCIETALASTETHGGRDR